MKKAQNLTAIAALLAIVSAPSLFAEQRHDEWTNRSSNGRIERRSVTLEGRIRSIDRDRNGFVIDLERSSQRLYAANDAIVRNPFDRDRRDRVRELRRGDVIRVRGFAGARGDVLVDSIDVLRDADARGASRLSGVVEQVDRDRGVIWLREDRGRRLFAVEMDRFERRTDGYGYDFRDVRRGDRITVRGEWRGERFLAFDVDRDVRR
jgi:hypothetical protein